MKQTNYERKLEAAFNNMKVLQGNVKTGSGFNEVLKQQYMDACDEYNGMKAIVKDIKKHLVDFTPAAVPKQWDAIEIEAITMYWYKDKGKIKVGCERTDEDDDTYFYSVYLHDVNGGVQCIADVPTLALAKSLAKLIEVSMKNYKKTDVSIQR